MKTSEFIKKVEELGHYASESGSKVAIHSREKDGVKAVVRTTHLHQVDSLYGGDIPKSLWELLIAYTSTPIKERQEEKRYYLKFKGLDIFNDYEKHLVIVYTLCEESGKWGWGTQLKAISLSLKNTKNKFTLTELEELGIDTDLYELEEVE